ncbi:MAG: hypothetical protein JW749_01280 [Sedimentisphaerales bacterium]|nr:hypothetical protein [Sedimentisphaerales bacterium]
MMTKRKGNFIEEHIEKAVLALAMILSVFLLFKFVVISPYVFNYGGRNFSAGKIDLHINEEAQKLKKLLNDDSAPATAYEPKIDAFAAMMKKAVEIDADILWPLPSAVELKIDKKYRIPQIPAVKDVSVEHIRAAAYVPNRDITAENAKDEGAYELDDIDLVTVQAGYDMTGLADAFEASFAGDDLPENWRDEQLAKPVFAAVDLQRQELGSDGDWGSWQSIPRVKIDPWKENFKTIENVNDLPSGSVTVRLLRLDQPKEQAVLLQPEPYQIASAEEEWYPPALHKKFLKSRSEKEAQERREHLEAMREQMEQEREKTRSTRDQRRPRTAPAAGGSSDDYMRMMMGTEPTIGTGTRTPTRTRTRTDQPSAFDLRKTAKPDLETEIYEEMKKIVLSDKDVGKLREQIVFWAHDDTVEPGRTYRYRIRLGVFNPVAGTRQLVEEDGEYENKVILWSKFSEVTETAAIPRRVYFFPVGVQEAAKQVEVQVYKYALGYWYNQQFNVKRGDVIGKEVKLEQASKDKGLGLRPAALPKAQEDDKNLTLPETIDYTTDAIVVDVLAASSYTGDRNLQQQLYYDMLYSFDGTNIERLATNLSLWPEELKAKHTEIKAMEKKPKLAFRAWSSASVLGGTRLLRGVPSRTSPTRGGEERMSQEDMMLMMMMTGVQP